LLTPLSSTLRMTPMLFINFSKYFKKIGVYYNSKENLKLRMLKMFKILE
jgi:hypothetical protein